VNECKCGYSASEAIEQIASEFVTVPSREIDKKERAISIERRRIYNRFSRVPEKFTIKEIAVKAQVSESTVRKTLTELSEDGFLLSEESIDGTMFYYLTEDGYSRFLYGSETIGHWGPLRDKKKLYNVPCAVSEPITIKEICKRSGASEYLIRKTIKFLEKHGEVTCEDRNARPRKYLVKAGDIAESLLTVK